MPTVDLAELRRKKRKAKAKAAKAKKKKTPKKKAKVGDSLLLRAGAFLGKALAPKKKKKDDDNVIF